MIMLRFLALPTAFVNTVCMLLAGVTRDYVLAGVGWFGAVMGLAAWFWYREELDAMGQNPMGYRNLAMRLRWEIKEAGYTPGARLPSTKSFAEQYGTTRTTVTRALKILAEEGIVEVVRGRGTYVNGIRTDRPKDRIEQHLLQVINTQPIGTAMPDSKWIALNLKASPMTVRRVEKRLLDRGLIRRTRTGSYVKA